MADIRAARPDGRAGYAGASLALARLGRGAEADALLEAGLASFGESTVLLREYALSAMYQERHDAAVDRWDRLRALVPDDPDGYRFGALALRLAGDVARAEAVVQAGIALFPDHGAMRIEQAHIASQCGDWALARDLWDALVAGHPGNAEVTENAALAAFQFRLSRLEQLNAQQLDVMDGPVLVGMSEADVAQAVALMGLADTKALQERFMQFESLGHSCEFGLVQRRFGAEPISLLRWNSIHLPQLVHALERKFVHIERPDNLVLAEAGGEYILRDLTYLTTMHSFVRVGQAEPERLLVQQGKRLAFLRRKLMDDLAAGEKIFVHVDNEMRPETEWAALHRAFRACSPGVLLYVRLAERPAQIGTVEDAGNGLLLGHIDRLGRGDDGSWNISFDVWMALCRTAWELSAGSPSVLLAS
jgi:tetratricopeptide (TPR) repeat protein